MTATFAPLSLIFALVYYSTAYHKTRPVTGTHNHWQRIIRYPLCSRRRFHLATAQIPLVSEYVSVCPLSHYDCSSIASRMALMEQLSGSMVRFSFLRLDQRALSISQRGFVVWGSWIYTVTAAMKIGTFLCIKEMRVYKERATATTSNCNLSCGSAEVNDKLICYSTNICNPWFQSSLYRLPPSLRWMVATVGDEGVIKIGINPSSPIPAASCIPNSSSSSSSSNSADGTDK